MLFGTLYNLSCWNCFSNVIFNCIWIRLLFAPSTIWKCNWGHFSPWQSTPVSYLLFNVCWADLSLSTLKITVMLNANVQHNAVCIRSASRSAICWHSVLLRSFLQVTHLKRVLPMQCNTFGSDYPESRGSDGTLCEMSTLMLHSLMVLTHKQGARWWRPGMMMGLVSSVPSPDCVIRPPTVSNPLLSMMGCSFLRLFWEGRFCFSAMHFSSLKKHSCYTLLITRTLDFSSFSSVGPER